MLIPAATKLPRLQSTSNSGFILLAISLIWFGLWIAGVPFYWSICGQSDGSRNVEKWKQVAQQKTSQRRWIRTHLRCTSWVCKLIINWWQCFYLFDRCRSSPTPYSFCFAEFIAAIYFQWVAFCFCYTLDLINCYGIRSCWMCFFCRFSFIDVIFLQFNDTVWLLCSFSLLKFFHSVDSHLSFSAYVVRSFCVTRRFYSFIVKIVIVWAGSLLFKLKRFKSTWIMLYCCRHSSNDAHFNEPTTKTTSENISIWKFIVRFTAIKSLQNKSKTRLKYINAMHYL